ncbi:f-box domain-containing protein [Botrytis cinerea]
MDINSPKRRKLSQRTPDQAQTAKGKGKEVMTVTTGQNGWPPHRLPVEIFNLIIKNLPRSTIHKMRLVNHEFEANVSEYLFKYVVVPFRPEIYGIASEPSTSHSSILLQDKGMRIFQGFGRHIRHFAMSFEVDIAKLTKPPEYNRYAQLEGLEQKADETRTMTKAFQFVVAAEELGLSIDGGLGWLAGPDVNHKVIQRGEKPAVFGSTRFEPESEPAPKQNMRPHQVTPPFRTELLNDTRSLLQRVFQESGYGGEQINQYLSLSHPNGGPASAHTQDGVPHAPSIPYTDFEEGIARILGNHFGSGNPAVVDEEEEDDDERLNAEDRVSTDGEDESNGQSEGNVSNNVPERSGFNAALGRKPRLTSKGIPLKPNDLTCAQKEMLLELEWAQRAFMQTFTIAVIDSPVTFAGVKKLTIARLPNRHLPNLIRDDFWNSLPNLLELSLGIIPDWRELVKLPTSWVQDIKLRPSKAVTGVFQLLSKQISRRQQIESLHFEWVGGGEYAPGLFCRNQHILAAPIVSDSMSMVSRKGEKEVLSLPYIKNLSLKNCWLSPHLLTRFVNDLKQCSLESLTLDSVSLTAFIRPGQHPMPRANHQQNALAQAMAVDMAANMGFANNHHLAAHAALFPPNMPAVPPFLAAAPQPRSCQWLADLRHSNESSAEPQPKTQSSLKQLVFKSCGYARLPLEFNQSAIHEGGSEQRGSVPAGVTKRINDYESIMMKPGDSLLASITNAMSDLEVEVLQNVWNMTLGWGNLPTQLTTEANHDGILRAGLGRFNGFIVAAAPTSASAPEV